MGLAFPFDNNQAERDIRWLKVRQKLAGYFRTSAGARRSCLIHSYLRTLSKQGQAAFPALIEVVSGKPRLPALPC